jgi:hypothetical protein
MVYRRWYHWIVGFYPGIALGTVYRGFTRSHVARATCHAESERLQKECYEDSEYLTRLQKCHSFLAYTYTEAAYSAGVVDKWGWRPLKLGLVIEIFTT